MGMQKKLQRHYEAGYLQACNDTWDLIEQAVKKVEGIGPKTHKKMMDAIVDMAKQEARKRGV